MKQLLATDFDGTFYIHGQIPPENRAGLRERTSPLRGGRRSRRMAWWPRRIRRCRGMAQCAATYQGIESPSEAGTG